MLLCMSNIGEGADGRSSTKSPHDMYTHVQAAHVPEHLHPFSLSS